jgi:hypothetical protein
MHAVKLLHPKHWAALFFFTFGLFVQSFMFYRFQMVLFPGQKLPALTGYRRVHYESRHKNSSFHENKQEIFNKISSQEIFLHLAGDFVILYTRIPHSRLLIAKTWQKRFAISWDCLVSWLKFITLYGTIYVLWNLPMQEVYIFNWHRKFLFWDFAAKKRNIFYKSGSRSSLILV